MLRGYQGHRSLEPAPRLELVGGWTNPFWKICSSNWVHLCSTSPIFGVNIKRYWKPPPRGATNKCNGYWEDKKTPSTSYPAENERMSTKKRWGIIFHHHSTFGGWSVSCFRRSTSICSSWSKLKNGPSWIHSFSSEIFSPLFVEGEYLTFLHLQLSGGERWKIVHPKPPKTLAGPKVSVH